MLMVPIDFHSIFKVNGYHKLSGYQLYNIYRRKKLILVWNIQYNKSNELVNSAKSNLVLANQ